MFLSNIPWKSPITWSPFLRISQFCEASPAKTLEAEFLVEAPRRFEVLDSQADRKRPEFHAALLSDGKPPVAARPKLSDPAHGTRGLQPERDGRIRCSAW
jgi:hypothetical protein